MNRSSFKGVGLSEQKLAMLASIRDEEGTQTEHSLLATRVITRIRAAFQLGIPLSRIFEAPTIKQLALLIAQTEQARQEEIVRVLEELEAAPVPKVPFQRAG